MGETKRERAIQAAIEAANQEWRRMAASQADAWSAGIDAYLAVMRAPDPGEIQVRAMVGVGPAGQVLIIGDSALNDDEIRHEFEDLDWPSSRVWVEAIVPAYRPVTEDVVEGWVP